MAFKLFKVPDEFKHQVYKSILDTYGEPISNSDEKRHTKNSFYDLGGAMMVAGIMHSHNGEQVWSVRIGGSDESVAETVQKLDLENLAEEIK